MLKRLWELNFGLHRAIIASRLDTHKRRIRVCTTTWRHQLLSQPGCEGPTSSLTTMLALLLSTKSNDANVVLRDAQWPARAGAPLLPEDRSLRTCPQCLRHKPRANCITVATYNNNDATTAKTDHSPLAGCLFSQRSKTTGASLMGVSLAIPFDADRKPTHGLVRQITVTLTTSYRHSHPSVEHRPVLLQSSRHPASPLLQDLFDSVSKPYTLRLFMPAF